MGAMSLLGKWQKLEEDPWHAFDAEATRWIPDVFRVAVWLTRDRDDAEDLVQETMIQAMRSFHRYEPGTNCRAWLIAILHNLNLKRLRKLGRVRMVDSLEDEIAETIMLEPSVPENLEDKQIIDALSELPDAFKSVVILADIEEFSYKEISQILDVPIGTVMSRLSRGRKILRQQLAQVAREYGVGGRQLTAG